MDVGFVPPAEALPPGVVMLRIAPASDFFEVWQRCPDAVHGTVDFKAKILCEYLVCKVGKRVCGAGACVVDEDVDAAPFAGYPIDHGLYLRLIADVR